MYHEIYCYLIYVYIRAARNTYAILHCLHHCVSDSSTLTTEASERSEFSPLPSVDHASAHLAPETSEEAGSTRRGSIGTTACERDEVVP